MFSTKCMYCRTLISLKPDELRTVVAEAEAKKETLYAMHCPRCQRVNKIQLKELKRRLPPEPKPEPAPESEPNSEPARDADPTAT